MKCDTQHDTFGKKALAINYKKKSLGIKRDRKRLIGRDLYKNSIVKKSNFMMEFFICDAGTKKCKLKF